MEGNIRGLFDK